MTWVTVVVTTFAVEIDDSRTSAASQILSRYGWSCD
jgi:hypothetical protein